MSESIAEPLFITEESSPFASADAGKEAQQLLEDGRQFADGSVERWLVRLYERNAGGITRVLDGSGSVIGTGFVVGAGLIATDLSVARILGEEPAHLRFISGCRQRARVLAFDTRAEVALLLAAELPADGFVALSLSKPTTLKSDKVACIGFHRANDFQEPVVSSGILRGIKFDKRVELISRISGAPDCCGSPILDRQGRVIGLYNKRKVGLDKGAGAEHLRAMVRAVRLVGVPEGKVLQVVSRVGQEPHTVAIGKRDYPSSLLSEDLQKIRASLEYRRHVENCLTVSVVSAKPVNF